MSSLDLAASYGTADELRQAAAEARKVRQALGAALRTADDIVREYNPLHNRFRPRTRSGRAAASALRKAMPEHARTAAVTADRLREQRRCLNKTADALEACGHLAIYETGPGLAQVDLTAAPTLQRIRVRWLDARADAGTALPDTPVAARLAQLIARADALLEKHR